MSCRHAALDAHRCTRGRTDFHRQITLRRFIHGFRLAGGLGWRHPGRNERASGLQLNESSGIGCLLILLTILALPDEILMTGYAVLVKITLKRYPMFLAVLVYLQDLFARHHDFVFLAQRYRHFTTLSICSWSEAYQYNVTCEDFPAAARRSGRRSRGERSGARWGDDAGSGAACRVCAAGRWR